MSKASRIEALVATILAHPDVLQEHRNECLFLRGQAGREVDPRLTGRTLIRIAYMPGMPRTDEITTQIRTLAQDLSQELLQIMPLMPPMSHTVDAEQIMLDDLAEGGTLLAGTLRAIDAIKTVGTTSTRNTGYENIQPLTVFTPYGVAAYDALLVDQRLNNGNPAAFRVGLTPYGQERARLQRVGLSPFLTSADAEAFLTESFALPSQAFAALKTMVADAASARPPAFAASA